MTQQAWFDSGLIVTIALGWIFRPNNILIRVIYNDDQARQTLPNLGGVAEGIQDSTKGGLQ